MVDLSSDFHVPKLEIRAEMWWNGKAIGISDGVELRELGLSIKPLFFSKTEFGFKIRDNLTPSILIRFFTFNLFKLPLKKV